MSPSLLEEILIWYYGKEFSMHKIITEQTGLACYFATPYHSWERGLNEHTNGLVRQYFPKACNFANLTDKDVEYVENKLKCAVQSG